MSDFKIVAKTTNDFYPDLIRAGGLTHALQATLREINSPLNVEGLGGEHDFLVYARVASKSRSSQVYIASQERLFLFDFWARGVQLARGQVQDLVAMARAIHWWAMSGCGTDELTATFPFVAAEEVAATYERGEEVEARWQAYINGIHFPELVELVAAASQRSELRQLFPYTSLNRLCFSRCTGYPFTRDTPHVQPTEQGVYEVLNPSGAVIGRGNAEEAVALVIANLPPACGKAVPGTAEDLFGDVTQS